MRKLYLLWSAMLALSIHSCALKPAEYGTRVYPSELREASSRDVPPAMQVMAYEITALDKELGKKRSVRERKTEVLAILERIEETAKVIQGEKREHPHPLFDGKIGLFLEDLKEAKKSVTQDNPDYVKAGKVASACQYCHGRDPTAPEFSPTTIWMVR